MSFRGGRGGADRSYRPPRVSGRFGGSGREEAGNAREGHKDAVPLRTGEVADALDGAVVLSQRPRQLHAVPNATGEGGAADEAHHARLLVAQVDATAQVDVLGVY